MRQIKTSDMSRRKPLSLPDTDDIRLQADDWSELVFPSDIAELTPESRSIGSCLRGTMVTISEQDHGLSEEPEDTSLDRRERRKRFGRCHNRIIGIHLKCTLRKGF